MRTSPRFRQLRDAGQATEPGSNALAGEADAAAVVDRLDGPDRQAESVDFNELYAASYRRLVLQVFAVCGDLPDAEDAVQEAFVTAIRKRREIATIGNPEAWIRTVALNRVRNGWRHANVVRRFQATVPGQQAAVDLGPDHVAIITALMQLGFDQRQVIVMHHFADLSTADIAHELNVAEGTVKSRLARGRQHLASLLGDPEEQHHA
jgi:RNA polymerase sigma-70 factor (sigma-E family)